MLLKIDKTKPVPLYKQIIEEIKRLIHEGALETGHPLPSSRTLAKKLGVNRSTIYQAYEELQAQGYLFSRPGSYNIVLRRQKEVSYNPDRKSLIAWDRASSPEAKKIYEIYLDYSPEQPRNLKPDSSVISLASLNLDPRLYPLQDFRRVVYQVLLNHGQEALQYGTYQGYGPLREYIAQRLRLHGISVSGEEVLIAGGSQQAIDLVVRMLCKANDRVVIEAPTYANVIPLLKFNRVKMVPVPMKPNGMDLRILEKVLAREKVSFIYTIPNFHNPTGITSGHQHRERLLNLCLKHRVPLVEDGFEEEMKYFGRVPLPIKSIDEKNIVIYLGTFSKALFPGLRMGWITADKECIQRIMAIKRFSDLTSNNLSQVIMYRFCKDGYYDLHLKRMHRIFRKRMQIALAAIEEWLPRTVFWTKPMGGYTIWVRAPEKLSEDELQAKLLPYGVIVSPGTYYFPHQRSSEYFRLCIAQLDEEEIKEGIRRLGKALQFLFPLKAQEKRN